jgi:hypothetical protein
VRHFSVWEVRDLGDASTPMFPVCGEDYRPVPNEDESGFRGYRLSGLNLFDVEQRQLHLRSSWSEGTADLLISDQRIIVTSRNFDKVKFDVGDVLGDALFGPVSAAASLALEVAITAGGAARNKLRKKVLCAHIYYPWVRRISFRPRLSRKEPAVVRLSFLRKRNGTIVESYLELSLGSHDTYEIANDLRRRIAQWYFDNRSPTPNGELSHLKKVLTSRLQLPVGTATSGMDISLYASADEEHTPKALEAAADDLEGKSELGILIARSRDCRPPIVIFKLPGEVEGRKEGLSVWVDAAGELFPIDEEEALFCASVRAYASWHVDPENHLPDGRQTAKSALLQGECRILCTSKRLAVLLTEGQVPGGTVRKEGRNALLAVFPLEMIDRIIAMSHRNNAEKSPSYILIVDCDDDTWGELRISMIHEYQIPNGERWSQIEGSTDLRSAVAFLAEAIARARGLPLPLGKKNNTEDFIYRITPSG